MTATDVARHLVLEPTHPLAQDVLPGGEDLLRGAHEVVAIGLELPSTVEQGHPHAVTSISRSASTRNDRPHAAQGAPLSASRSRSPHAHIHPTCLAGTPTTNA